MTQLSNFVQWMLERWGKGQTADRDFLARGGAYERIQGSTTMRSKEKGPKLDAGIRYDGVFQKAFF